MNRIHATLILYLREQTTKDGGELAAKFASLSDETIVRMMFSNYRGREDSRGLRLTKFGLQVMKRYFKGCEIDMPSGEKLQALHLLYLDSKCTMPYYCGDDGFVLYDQQLGIKLKLADGRINTLIEIESVS